MPTVDVVDLSRLQFAVTALYHFLFVPLTLGLSWILVIMESVYVMTGKEIYRDMTKFWGKLFGINFAMGVATGHHDGVPVRHQLGVLLALRRRHLRRAAGARGPDGVLPGVDVRRPVLLRLGPAVEAPAPAGDLPRRAGLEPLGAVDPDRQRVDAEPGRRGIQRRHDADGAHELLRAAVQSGRRAEVRAHASPPATSPRRCSCSASPRTTCSTCAIRRSRCARSRSRRDSGSPRRCR